MQTECLSIPIYKLLNLKIDSDQNHVSCTELLHTIFNFSFFKVLEYQKAKTYKSNSI